MNTAVCKKLLVAQLVNKFLAYDGTKKLKKVFTTEYF